jgi:hypothetical protein
MQDIIIKGDGKAQQRQHKGRDFHPVRKLRLRRGVAIDRGDGAAPKLRGLGADERMLEQHAGKKRAAREHKQRRQHGPGRFVHIGELDRGVGAMARGLIMGMVMPMKRSTAIGAVERHQELPPGIEGRHEHARQRQDEGIGAGPAA